uniref:Olfactomedin-like domain-containing protein n=1 Tax=Monopterus albus TaxID=43700 RepID=A0A3Q3KCL4_MONAL
MKLYAIALQCALFTLAEQASRDDSCVCELRNSEQRFPHDKLSTVEDNTSECNSNITSQKTLELESLLLGLERRLPQLQEDVAILERENDGGLYGALSLQVIENEMRDIMQLIEKLNSTTLGHQQLITDTTQQLEDFKAQMVELEKYDTMQVVKRQKANRILKRDLDQCKNGLHPTNQPTQPTQGNVQIHSTNPTTNTIQGPNVVMYGEALYYNCYNQDAVCRFNLTTKTVTTLQLPKGTRFNSKGNFCHLEECYPFTDMDLATDESGVWVIYTTTQDFGNLVLSKVEEGEPLSLGQTWHTSVYKQAVTNTFMACGVLYATRYVNKGTEEIFYSFDTATGAERFNIGIFIFKMAPNIYALNYSPVDQMLHAYSDAYMVSYKVLFE